MANHDVDSPPSLQFINLARGATPVCVPPVPSPQIIPAVFVPCVPAGPGLLSLLSKSQPIKSST